MGNLIMHVGNILPMQCATITVENTGTSELITRRADTTNSDTPFDKWLEFLQQGFGIDRVEICSRANKEGI